MTETHVMSALRDKYAELLGRLKKHEKEAEALRVDLAHVEASIRMFKPDWDEKSVRGKRPRKPSRWPKSGQGVQLTLEILRTAGEPMTAHDIAIEAMMRCGMPTDDGIVVKAVASGLRSGLRRRIGKGIIKHEGFPTRWSLG